MFAEYPRVTIKSLLVQAECFLKPEDMQELLHCDSTLAAGLSALGR